MTSRRRDRCDVTFVGPLGETCAAAAYIEGIKGMVKLVERVIEREAIAEGDNVCLV